MLGRLVATADRRVRVRALGGARRGEIQLTRFLRCAAVTPGEMIEVAGARTGPRCAGRHVLAIQDTTVVRSRGGGGLYLHAMIAVDAEDGAILGAVHGQFLSRGEGKRGTQRARPIEDKESHRWLEGADRAARLCASAAKITVIADRESGAREFVGNETLNGRGAALAIADRGCGDVIVVDLGAGALRHLQMTQVSAWAAPAGTAGSDALRLFAENKLPAAAAHEGESQHGGCCCGHGGAAVTSCCRS